MSDGALPALRKGPLTSAHIVRWLAAQQNWDKIHHDLQYAQQTAGLPGTVVNGALKQHFIVQFLDEAFGEHAWIWRLQYDFVAPDPVGSTLEVRGRTTGTSRQQNRDAVEVDVEIVNLDTTQVSTRGKAVVLLEPGKPVADALDSAGDFFAKPESKPPEAADDMVPEVVRSAIGRVLEERASVYPLDLGRLRIFASAIMGLRPRHFHPDHGSAIVAPPLFPLHGIELLPGDPELSTDPTALGREGATEIGRNLADQFELPPGGLLNGGNKVQIHSFARPGERICGRSVLAAAHHRQGSRRGSMLFLESINDYWESSGRPLLTERQTLVCVLGKA